MNPEWRSPYDSDWHDIVVYHPLMHVSFILSRFAQSTRSPICAAPRMYKRTTTNCIAAKILQQNNFGIGKFPDLPFCVGLGTRLYTLYVCV